MTHDNLTGKIYAVGGHDGMEFLDTVEMFDPAENKLVTVLQIQLHKYNSAPSLVANLLQIVNASLDPPPP